MAWKLTGIILILGLVLFPDNGLAQNTWITTQKFDPIEFNDIKSCRLGTDVAILSKYAGHEIDILENNSKSYLVTVTADNTSDKGKIRILFSCDRRGILSMRSQVKGKY